jgi:hypothetical protein
MLAHARALLASRLAWEDLLELSSATCAWRRVVSDGTPIAAGHRPTLHLQRESQLIALARSPLTRRLSHARLEGMLVPGPLPPLLVAFVSQRPHVTHLELHLQAAEIPVLASLLRQCRHLTALILRAGHSGVADLLQATLESPCASTLNDITITTLSVWPVQNWHLLTQLVEGGVRHLRLQTAGMWEWGSNPHRWPAFARVCSRLETLHLHVCTALWKADPALSTQGLTSLGLHHVRLAQLGTLADMVGHSAEHLRQLRLGMDVYEPEADLPPLEGMDKFLAAVVACRQLVEAELLCTMKHGTVPAGLLRALVPSASTLRSLVIDGGDERYPTWEALGALVDRTTQLHTLRIRLRGIETPWSTIARRLPASLRTLSIAVDVCPVFANADEAHRVAQTVCERCPRLRRFEVPQGTDAWPVVTGLVRGLRGLGTLRHLGLHRGRSDVTGPLMPETVEALGHLLSANRGLRTLRLDHWPPPADGVPLDLRPLTRLGHLHMDWNWVHALIVAGHMMVPRHSLVLADRPEARTAPEQAACVVAFLQKRRHASVLRVKGMSQRLVPADQRGIMHTQAYPELLLLA